MHRNQGESLLEVMISLFIFTFIGIGVAIAQQKALKTMVNIGQYSSALSQTSNLMDRVLLNSSFKVPQNVVKTWQNENKFLLGVEGKFFQNNNYFYIELKWINFYPRHDKAICPANYDCINLKIKFE